MQGEHRVNVSEADSATSASFVEKARALEGKVRDTIMEVEELVNKITTNADKIDPVGGEGISKRFKRAYLRCLLQLT